MPPLTGLTSNTAIPKGWLRKSGEEISIFLLPPLKSMLDSWCSLESTQYKRWFSKSLGGKRRWGIRSRACWISAPLYPLPAQISGLGLRLRPAWDNHQEKTGTGTMKGHRHKTHGAPDVARTRCYNRFPIQGRQAHPG